MSVVRGRPPGLAGGINGASRAYCSSLRACPAPKSPTRARLSAVHMACLREGLLPSRTGRRPACATCSPRRRRLLKQPLIGGGPLWSRIKDGCTFKSLYRDAQRQKLNCDSNEIGTVVHG